MRKKILQAKDENQIAKPIEKEWPNACVNVEN